MRTRKFQTFIKPFDSLNRIDKKQFSKRGFIAKNGPLYTRYWWRS